MTQSFKSLATRANELNRDRKFTVQKKQVADLQAKLDKARERLRAEEARAEIAERQVRQIASERDIWKLQAQEAQAKLKSMGQG